ncbi:TVP38/TMEM64 family protein [Fictibacillus sp. BK138]|uniref:TVP38/TMEM64 family protein n=1 Tax=Fictibacillus sp. BK138 TaxID=2512121 RepID=UPI0010295AC0|nr:VTT domain-containing protein [Fictibacillus sp. BK138]RZT23571.1 putative membrane protein YdjX (TVP38/TMEM64 family) [Fictibacillus sp. BK138]
MTDTFSRKQVTLELLLHITLISMTLVTLIKLLPTIQPIFKLVGVGLSICIVTFDLLFLCKRNLQSLKITRLIALYFFAVSMFAFAIFYVTKLLVLTDMYGFENLLKLHESAAKLIYLAICFAQPILLPLPEVVTVAAASAVFGPVTAISLGFLGTLTGIIIMYFIARFGGHRIVSRLIKEEHLTKYQTYVQRNEVLFLAMMFIIPILPDEIICIGAGLGGVTFRSFFIIAALSKLFTSTIFAYSVELAKIFSLTTTELMVYASIIAGAAFLLTTMIKRNVRQKEESIKLNLRKKI